MIPGQKTSKTQKLKVAAYCRVSTDLEEQQSSYENQVRYYTDYIMHKPDTAEIDRIHRWLNVRLNDKQFALTITADSLLKKEAEPTQKRR